MSDIFTFDRGSNLGGIDLGGERLTFGRGKAKAPVPSPYADITATNPDLLVPLKYEKTAADGQILYEDSGLTTPVDAAGEPIGGVDWVDNTETISQTTDASRPTWLGEGVAAEFDGADDFLQVSGTAVWDFLAEQQATIFAHVRLDNLSEDVATIFGSYTGASTDSGIIFGVTSTGAIRVSVYRDDNAYSETKLSATSTVATGSFVTVGASWSGSGVEFFYEGASVGTTTGFTMAAATTGDSLPPVIGAYPLVAGTSQNVWDGAMKNVVVYDSVKTAADFADYDTNSKAI